MANSDYTPSDYAGSFTPLAELGDSIDYLDHVITLGRTNFPTPDSLQIGMACLCNDEFMQLTAITEDGIVVKRGCADTVPARHAKGSFIWFFDNSKVLSDRRERSAGEEVGVKYSPSTIGGGAFPPESSPADSVQFNFRFYRPYPPGQMRVNGDRWWTEHTITTDEPILALTWAHRDRIVEADQLVDHDEGDIGPEGGTSYTVRVYDKNMVLKRTYAGVMESPRDRYGNRLAAHWEYNWLQAMTDLGAIESEAGTLVNGYLTLFSTRDGMDSWQGYVMPFRVNTQGYFVKAAQLAALAAQNLTDADNDAGGPQDGAMVAQLAALAAQNLTDADNEASGPTHGLYVAGVHQGVGQETNYYTTLNRNLFEAPYALLRKRGVSIGPKVITVAARPSDKLTDAHSIWTRYAWPLSSADSQSFVKRVDPAFTPWVTLGQPLDYLDTVITIGKSSFLDGVSLTDVQVGQVALVDAEIIRIGARDASTITIARGCYDTVPTPHSASARVWFFETAGGNDPTVYPYTLDTFNQSGSVAQVKMVPAVYGPPLNLAQIPTDSVTMQHRVERPYAPGEVLVNGLPWYRGCVIAKDADVAITWNHRNRDTQGGNAVDHHAPTRAPEDGQKYRLAISLTLRDQVSNRSYTVVVREQIVDGSQFTYTYAMAAMDGYRAGTLLKVCGRVTVGMTLEAVRGNLSSWQGYVIPLALPSYNCPPGQLPGGGQLPPTPGGGGNGDTGSVPGEGGGNNTGGGDGPGDNDAGDNGTGGPPDTKPPTDWPDPVDPPEPENPGDPHPELAAHWDTNWDRHWDAYAKDDHGG